MKTIMKSISVKIPLESYEYLKQTSRKAERSLSFIIRKGSKLYCDKINKEYTQQL